MGQYSDERAIWLGRHVLPHEPALRAWLRRRRLDGLEIDDVIQETYTRLVAGRERRPYPRRQELCLPDRGLGGDRPSAPHEGGVHRLGVRIWIIWKWSARNPRPSAR